MSWLTTFPLNPRKNTLSLSVVCGVMRGGDLDPRSLLNDLRRLVSRWKNWALELRTLKNDRLLGACCACSLL